MVPHNIIASEIVQKLFIRKSNCKRKSAYLGMSTVTKIRFTDNLLPITRKCKKKIDKVTFESRF